MPLYSYAGLAVASELPIEELRTAGSDGARLAPDFTFCLLPSPPPEPAAGDWIRHLRTRAGDTFASLARTGEGFLLRFPGLADFVLPGDGGQIAAWPAPQVDAAALRHLLLDQILPRLLAHRGHLVLHASAVFADGRAIAFVGASGRGKSTLAASLHVAGYPLLTDDAVLVTAGDAHATALPIYPGLRLWQPSVTALFAETPGLAPVAQYTPKHRVVMAEAEAPAPLPLAALYILAAPRPDGAEAVAVSLQSSREGCLALIRHSFQLDGGDPRHAARLLLAAGAVAVQLPIFELAYPRDFSYLPAVHQAILESLGGPVLLSPGRA